MNSIGFRGMIWILRGRPRDIRRQKRRTLSTRGQRKGDGKKRAEGCAVPSRMYAARVIPRDVYAWRSRRFLPPGNNVVRCQRECKRGSALAYCLKLLIGLRSDGAFPRYAVLFSFSLFLLSLSLSNSSSLLSLSASVSASMFAWLRLLRCLLSTTQDRRPRSRKRRGCELLRKVPMEFQWCTPRPIRCWLFWEGEFMLRRNLRLFTSKTDHDELILI